MSSCDAPGTESERSVNIKIDRSGCRCGRYAAARWPEIASWRGGNRPRESEFSEFFRSVYSRAEKMRGARTQKGPSCDEPFVQRGICVSKVRKLPVQWRVGAGVGSMVVPKITARRMRVMRTARLGCAAHAAS